MAHVVTGQQVSTQRSTWVNWDSIKSAVGYSSQRPSNKASIIFAQFNKLALADGSVIDCLLIGYHNGFQIWDISTLNDTHKAVELASLSLFKVGAITVVKPPPNEDPLSTYYKKRPLLALASAEGAASQYPSDCLYFYSLSTNSLMFDMQRRLDSPITEIWSTTQYIAVGTKLGTIYVLDNVEFTVTHQISTKPHHDYGAIFSLGPRWLAFQSVRPPLDGFNSTSDSTAESLISNSLETAKSLLSNPSTKELYHLTTKGFRSAVWYGTKTVQKFLSGAIEDAKTTDSRSGLNSEPGIVEIVDVVSEDLPTLVHFKAEKEPLTKISFDPTGTLLLTCRDSGQELTVWRISPNGNPYQSHQRLYILDRGLLLNQSCSQDICWSHDSTLVGLTSKTGTTHVFPICLDGALVSSDTHTQKRLNYRYSPHIQPSRPPKLCTIHSDGTPTNHFAATAALFPDPSPKRRDCAQLYHFSVEGTLTQHYLQMRKGDNAGDLIADVNLRYKWDLARTTVDWPDVPFKRNAQPLSNSSGVYYKDKKDDAEKLLANVEINTCDLKSDTNKPFWQSPNMFTLIEWTALPNELRYDFGNPSKSQDLHSSRNAGEILLENDIIYQNTPSKDLQYGKRDEVVKILNEEGMSKLTIRRTLVPDINQTERLQDRRNAKRPSPAVRAQVPILQPQPAPQPRPAAPSYPAAAAPQVPPPQKQIEPQHEDMTQSSIALLKDAIAPE